MSSLAQRISSTVAKRVVASPEPTPLAIYCYKKHFMRQQQIKEKIKGLQNPQKADCGPLGEYKCDSLNVPSAPITGDITGAAKLAEPQAKTLGMGVEEFMAKQASERAYLIYRFSSSERQEAIRLAMDGEGFDQGLTEEERQANTS
ncbi:hypothetical protein FOZ63_005130, partial [Perkinsus olseni]